MSSLMRHPDLGDLIDVPDFAVRGFEERGYEHVDEQDQAAAEPVATTSETAGTAASDDGAPAVTPAD